MMDYIFVYRVGYERSNRYFETSQVCYADAFELFALSMVGIDYVYIDYIIV